MNAAQDCRIRPYRDAVSTADPTLALEKIFFEASATQSFANAEERSAFYERWLGRYLHHYPNDAYLAVTLSNEVVGYVVGCLDDPAGLPLFSDIAYFEAFAHLTAQYPAHLHINVDARYRSAGIGAQLIARFITHAENAGSPGVHLVTGADSRNVRFYNRQGFVERGRQVSNGVGSVFLARGLAAAAPGDV